MIEQQNELDIVIWLTRHKKQISQILSMSGSFIPRIKQDIDAHSDRLDEYAEREVACLVDYVKLYFSKQKTEYRSLYIGERLKMAYEADCSSQERCSRLIEFMRRDKAAFSEGLTKDGTGILPTLDEFFDSIVKEYMVPVKKELKVLFIGDCLHLDVIGFLSGMTMQYSTAIVPHFLTTKNVFQLCKELEQLKGNKFDVIFYSPISYDYNLTFSSMFQYKKAFIDEFNLTSILGEVVEHIEKTIDTLLTFFDCPTFVHNTSCVLREESPITGRIKSALMWRLRGLSTKYIDKQLRALIESRNSLKFKQLFLVDEIALSKNISAYQLGSYFYKSALQHPSKFGVLIANEYNRILYVIAHLQGKKLVVCDLDNTLWNGVIGEGRVDHFLSRQEILLKLKLKGVLLAINSKNDSKNVHWEGGLLSEDDFVHQDINWEPKVNAFPKMQTVLNLKTKDFIFIDDRADELEFVGSVYPEILCLDATDSFSWSSLNLWESILDGSDRTKIYKEREERGGFFEISNSKDSNEADMFKNLDLVLTIQEVGETELKRTVELINRTNQFNMRGSRTSFSEVKKWTQSDRFTVLQASMKDKFGDMGVVSIIIFEDKNDCFDILTFVLSCRVFGYKVETAFLNEVKRRARKQNKKLIKGEYIETSNNTPCKSVFADEMFVKDGEVWHFFTSPDKLELDEPEWLKIVLK